MSIDPQTPFQTAGPERLDDQAAVRGNPSFVWRAGQERRLTMVRQHIPLAGRRVLDVGCGLGMYTSALRRHTPDVFGIEVELDRRNSAAVLVVKPG